MAIIMYALHENTCVYEVQLESFFKDLNKTYLFVCLYLKNLH
jgi:hypothetical protein